MTSVSKIRLEGQEIQLKQPATVKGFRNSREDALGKYDETLAHDGKDNIRIATEDGEILTLSADELNLDPAVGSAIEFERNGRVVKGVVTFVDDEGPEEPDALERLGDKFAAAAPDLAADPTIAMVGKIFQGITDPSKPLQDIFGAANPVLNRARRVESLTLTVNSKRQDVQIHTRRVAKLTHALAGLDHLGDRLRRGQSLSGADPRVLSAYHIRVERQGNTEQYFINNSEVTREQLRDHQAQLIAAETAKLAQERDALSRSQTELTGLNQELSHELGQLSLARQDFDHTLAENRPHCQPEETGVVAELEQQVHQRADTVTTDGQTAVAGAYLDLQAAEQVIQAADALMFHLAEKYDLDGQAPRSPVRHEPPAQEPGAARSEPAAFAFPDIAPAKATEPTPLPASQQAEVEKQIAGAMLDQAFNQQRDLKEKYGTWYARLKEHRLKNEQVIEQERTQNRQE